MDGWMDGWIGWMDGWIVKDHSDSKSKNPLLPHGLLFSISSKGCFTCTIPLGVAM